MGLIDILRGQVGAGSQLDLLAPSKRAMSKPAAYAGRRGRSPLVIDPRQRDYSASAVAYRCVHYIASNLASVDLEVLAGDEPVEGHEVAELWNRRPNALLSARAQKEVVWSRLELVGEQMLYLDRGDTGEGDATAMYPIFDPVEVVVDERLGGELQGFVVKTSAGQRVPLLPSEVLWLRYPHPFEEWGALPPWKAALYATEADAYARAWQRGEFEHGARPSSVVYLGDLEEDAHDAAVAEFKANVEGPENAGKSLLVSGTVQAKVDRLTLTPAEMSYLESRAANADEIMMAFGLRRDLLAGQATYENQRASKVAAWSDVLLPKLEVVASETDRQLLPDLAQTAAFDVSEVDALRENADAVWGRIVSAVVPDLLTMDEARAELGLEPLPERRGEVTLTEYRARIAVQTATGLEATGARSPLAGVPLAGPSRVRLYVGSGGLRAVVPGRTRRLMEAEQATRSSRKARTAPAILKVYARHERIGLRAVGRLARKQERIVLRRLRDLARSDLDLTLERWAALAEQARIGTTPWSELPVTLGYSTTVRVAADDLLDGPYWREQTQEYLQSFMAGVWEAGAENAANTLGLSLDLFDAQVLSAMDTRAQVLADQVTSTTRQVLDAQLLQAGVEGGESIEELSARVKAVFSDLEGWRATAIARTETVGGFNAASRVGAMASGVVTGRRWLAAHDDRVRESHQGMDGEEVQGLHGAYSNGLMHPGDPNGPPSETVNCRCVETYMLDES